jgi:ubiquinone/menaquinone biosynthesis C-methylase UbiE
MAKAEVRNPLFARLYTRLSGGAEKAGAGEHRDENLAGLRGRVVEIGAGNGLNFAHYPPDVDEVVAVEPEPYLRARAQEAAAAAPVKVTVVDGTADRLPGADGEFDAAVASLVLCTVPDPAGALAEARRVLRPGGELRFYEHVRAPTPRLARWQDRLARRLWPAIGGGCHPNRDTEAAIAAAGFEVERARRFDFRPGPGMAIVEPHVIGVARRAA